MIELTVWRHKEYKDIYLLKNTSACCWMEDTEFYRATKNIKEAIEGASDPDFESFMKSFADDEGNTTLKVKVTDSKTVDIDGYTGTITKILVLPVREFEKVKLVEK